MNSVVLDKYQKSAVYTDKLNTLVVAAPGSGKTTVIINRVNYLISRGVNARNIIVITFTKASALNMKNRFLKICNGKEAPFFGTFHALFYKILRNRYKDINIIDSIDGYRVIKSVLIKFTDEVSDDKIREILNNISLYKSSGFSEDIEFSIDKKLFLMAYNAYEDFKNSRNLMDFDDLQINLKELILKDPAFLDKLRRSFKYILVDEFQDCDSLQLEILQLLTGGNSIFAVGDEDQCIYGFRGSKPECMVEFEKYFGKYKKYFLSFNYRSPKNIVLLSQELIKKNAMRNDKKVIPFKKQENRITIVNSITESQQAENISLEIMKLNALANSKFSDNAVLYRTNMEARSLIDVFIRKRIPFKILDKEFNFFEHFICKDILAYLKLSIDPTDKESFLRVINKPFRYISRTNLNIIKNHKIKEDLFVTLKNIKDIQPFQIKKIEELRKDVHYLSKISLQSAVEFVISDLGYYDYLNEYSKKFKMNIEELNDILQEFKQVCSEYKSILLLLAHVEEVKKEIEISKKKNTLEDRDAVILSTIHGVKGMEFKNVFLINCSEENMPHISSMDKDIEEERRLFYVAITRTIENLWICFANEIRGRRRQLSRFVKECNLKIDEITNSEYSIGDSVMHKSFGRGVIKNFSISEIEILFEDNIKRKFDTLVVLNNNLISK